MRVPHLKSLIQYGVEHSAAAPVLQNQQLESNVLAPLRQWIAAYRAFKDKMKVLDNTRLEFDAERRAFSKLDIKRVRQQQAADKIEPELAGKLEAKSGDLAGMRCRVLLHPA